MIYGPNSVAVKRPEGHVYQYQLQGGVWLSDADTTDLLQSLRDEQGFIWGWRFTVAADHSVEEYDAAGQFCR